ncbi:unnamed protein product [Scytosiphon promiscuus]
MALRKLLTCAVAVLSLALTLDLASGCRCLARDLCELVDASAVVVHATALPSCEETDQIGDVVYTLGVITVYKGEPEWIDPHENEITVTTSSNSCGVNLVIGEEYLVGLTLSSGYYTIDLCGLVQSWNEEDAAVLQAGSCDSDDDLFDDYV